MARLTVNKTYKLFIGGKFPRTESGRSIKVEDSNGITHICHGSRKDLRDAIEAARKAQPGWAAATAYNRGQVLYRMAEMLEGKRQTFIDAVRPAHARKTSAAKEVDAAIDRLVCYGGWADKYAQILGCSNPVAGPYYNFTVPEPVGVVAAVLPDQPPLLSLVTLLAPPLCAGNAVIIIAHAVYPLAATIFGEVCATSDVPAGVVNIITTQRQELVEHLAQHRDVDAIHAANLPRAETKVLRLGSAENVKRVHISKFSDEQWYDAAAGNSPWMIEPFVEMKTIWHPSST